MGGGRWTSKLNLYYNVESNPKASSESVYEAIFLPGGGAVFGVGGFFSYSLGSPKSFNIGKVGPKTIFCCKT